MSQQFMEMAQRISQKTGLPADWIYGQLHLESGGFSNWATTKGNNPGGLKQFKANPPGIDAGSPEGNNYQVFGSLQEFEDYFPKYLGYYRENGLFNAKTIEDYAQALKNGGYYGISPGEYAAGIRSRIGQSGMEPTGGMGMITNEPGGTQQQHPSGAGITDPTTGKVTIVPINQPPLKNYQNLLSEDAINKLMGTPIKNSKEAEYQAMLDAIPIIQAGFSGAISSKTRDSLMPYLTQLANAKAGAAGQGVNIENEMAKRQSMGELFKYLPKSQNPMEYVSALGMLEGIGGPKMSTDTMRYGWQTPDQSSSDIATIASGNANRNVTWQNAQMDNFIKTQTLAMHKMQLDLETQKFLASIQQAGKLKLEDLKDIEYLKSKYAENLQLTGDPNTWFQANKRSLASIASIELGRTPNEDELADWVNKSFPNAKSGIKSTYIDKGYGDTGAYRTAPRDPGQSTSTPASKTSPVQSAPAIGYSGERAPANMQAPGNTWNVQQALEFLRRLQGTQAQPNPYGRAR